MENTENDGKKETQGVYSALTKRPDPKVVDTSDANISYVAGVRIVDEIQQRKDRFNGWEKDENAQLVVSFLAQGEFNKFVGADLSEVDFSGADLSSINLQNADLKNANLSGVDLRGADLRGADLRGVNLEEADLEGANLEGALLDGAYLKNAKIIGAKLAKQALNELEKMQQMQRDAEEGKLDLRKVNLKYLDLRKLDLRGVDLTGVDLSGVNLVGVNLSGVKIDQKYLDGTYLFQQAAGRKVDIKKGNIAGLDLTSANQMKASMLELEILRRKRLTNQEEEQKHLEEINKIAEEKQVKNEQDLLRKRQQEESSNPMPEQSEDGLSRELEFLRSRRLNQPSVEEMKARLQDVVLENHGALKSGAKSLVTHRPRRKEELPPSKYDFPILYPVDEEEKDKEEKKTAVQEAVKFAGKVVQKVIQKVSFPRRQKSRLRVKRQRQKQRS
ncbi:MAG: pentapeptide repeat-containing protein [Alphaproteobacteria bacterium]|nr:pentapeptide repeat-containing protein [Alphaproteobacteria bacterium]MBO4644129.1 pentapeptide repeat-containing protein [Alphaproteobacteria bacterium]